MNPGVLWKLTAGVKAAHVQVQQISNREPVLGTVQAAQGGGRWAALPTAVTWPRA